MLTSPLMINYPSLDRSAWFLALAVVASEYVRGGLSAAHGLAFELLEELPMTRSEDLSQLHGDPPLNDILFCLFNDSLVSNHSAANLWWPGAFPTV